MTHAARQYAFKTMLMGVTKGEYATRFEEFRAALGVSRRMLYAYLNATWERPVTIPADKLMAAARFWGCTIEDLINEPENASL